MAGGTKSNRLIAEAMVRRGHEVNIVFSSLRRPWPRPIFGRRWRARAWQEVTTAGRQQHHLERSTATMIPVPRHVIRSEDVPDADVVIGTWWETMEWVAEWPRSKGIKAYFIRHHELHGGDVERVKATYRLPCIKLVIASWLQRVMLEDYGDSSAVLIPNGVDWSQFDSVPRRRNESPRIGVLYSQAAWKGFRTALRAAEHLHRNGVGAKLVTIGFHPLERSLRRCSFLEHHLRPPQDEIASIYRSCDCWVVASTSEGFGMPGLEAAACRCPIVSTRCGGPEDYVREGENGFLVPVGDDAAMADAIQRVLSQSDEDWSAMSERSYSIARQFDWDRSAERLERVLDAHLSGLMMEKRR